MNTNIDFYEAFAPFYEHIYRTIDAAETVRQWLMLLEPRGVVPSLSQRRIKPPPLLDIGCGLGWHLQPWSDYGFAVSGLDSSPTMLELAGRGRGGSNAPSCSFPLYSADIRFAQSLGEIQSRFSIATSHFNFLHLFNSSEISRILTGVAFALTPGAIWVTDVYLPRSIKDIIEEEVYHSSSGDRFMCRTGFYKRSERLFEQCWRIGDRDLIERYWLHTLASLRAATEHPSWRWFGCWDWHPEDPVAPWAEETETWERKLIILQRL